MRLSVICDYSSTPPNNFRGHTHNKETCRCFDPFVFSLLLLPSLYIRRTDLLNTFLRKPVTKDAIMDTCFAPLDFLCWVDQWKNTKQNKVKSLQAIAYCWMLAKLNIATYLFRIQYGICNSIWATATTTRLMQCFVQYQ